MTKNYEEDFAILDLNACILHSYHGAIDDEKLVGDDGEDVTNAHAGFNAFLDLYVLPILEDYQPRQMLCVIDRGTKYQLEIYPEYKQKREAEKKEKDPVLTGQIQLCKDLCKRFLIQIGAPIIGVKDVEADDVIGHLVKRLPGAKSIYSVDSDFVQLLDQPGVDLFLKNELVDDVEGSFKNSDCVEPVSFKVWRLFRSIVGKTSDGYGGIKGVGKGAWVKLDNALKLGGLIRLQDIVLREAWVELSTLDIPPKIRQQMDDQRVVWSTAFKVAGIHEELCWKPRNRKVCPGIDIIKRIGTEAELEKVMRIAHSEDRLEEFTSYLPKEWLIDANNFQESDLEEFAAMVQETPHVSFDYESWSEHQDREEFKLAAKGRNYVDVRSQNISGVSFNFGPNLQYTFYLTVDHKDSANLPKQVILQFLDQIPDSKVLVAQNASFELELTQNNLGRVLEDLHDTSDMQVYVDEEAEPGLKFQSKAHLNYDQVSYQEVTGGLPMNEISAERVVSYGCDDSLVTGRVYDSHKLIMLLEGTWDLYIESEPLVNNVTAHSHRKGNRMNWEFLQQMAEENQEDLTIANIKIHERMAGHCTIPSPASARAYFKAEEAYFKADLRKKFKLGKLPKKFQHASFNDETTYADVWRHAREILTAEYVEKTLYTPFKTRIEIPAFVPTQMNLFSIISMLGFSSRPQTYSIKNIKEWVDQHLIVDWTEESTTPIQHEEFLRLLQNAAANIVSANKRKGMAYDDFIDAAQRLIGEHGKDQAQVINEGDELSVGSPKQTQELLYLKMGLPVRLHSKVQPGSARSEYGVPGSPATSEDAINWALAEDMEGPEDWRIPVLESFKEAKGIKTQISLFDVPYPLWRHPDTGLIHPGVKNCGAKATKRMSSSAPNVMQVSTKTDMRKGFIPLEDDHVLVGIDWSGQELRITAASSRDKNMLSAYIGSPEQLRDLHSITGAGISKMEYKEFYKIYKDDSHPKHHYVDLKRRNAKTINFGIIYGLSALSLAQDLIIPQTEADAMMADTNATYPGLAIWQKATADEAREFGFVTTFFGGKKHARAAIFSKDRSLRGRVERQVINYKVQGCAANQLKRTFSMMWRTRIIQDLDVGFVLPVHDEVFASVPVQHVFEYINRLSHIMKLPIPGCDVPFEVDVAISNKSWGEMVELRGDHSQNHIDEVLALDLAA